LAVPFSALQLATRRAAIDGPGRTDQALRQQVASGQPPPELAALVRKIRDRAYTVTDRDLDVLRARYTDGELYELIVAAAIGAAEDRLHAALTVVDDAEGACG
jgi:hypothetical protein